MLSICIPVYNLDVTELVEDLRKQIAANQVEVEIVLIDDASNRQTKEANSHLANKVRYIELQENIGRARIRNLFLKYSEYDYLLFLDCDAKIVDSNFLQYYTDYIQAFAPDVLCGGSTVAGVTPAAKYRLRWTYGRLVESKTAAERAEKQVFVTQNFLIKKKILTAIPFNEQITKYGHEDTLLGLDLRNNKIEVAHFDNPVLNNDLDTNLQFLNKTKDSMFNLAKLYLDRQSKYDLSSVRIVRFYEKITRAHLIGPVKVLLGLLHPSFEFLLQRGLSSLFLFNLNKLYIFITEIKQKQKI